MKDVCMNPRVDGTEVCMCEPQSVKVRGTEGYMCES